MTSSAVSAARLDDASHLRAAALALALITVLAAGAFVAAQATIDARAASLEPEVNARRSRGLAVLRARLQQPNAVALFGSSELIYDVKNRPDRFFSLAPTGFTIVPIGSKAMTPLVQALAIQAIGPLLHSRPIIVSLTPFDPNIAGRRADWFAGNFSRLHAATAFTSDAIPRALRRETAQQLLNYPSALNLDPVLKVVAHVYATRTPVSRALSAFVLPLALLDRTWLSAVDRMLGAWDVLTHPAKPSQTQVVTTPIDWAALERTARSEYALVSRSNPFGFEDAVWKSAGTTLANNKGTPDPLFVSRLESWPVWSELATLARSAQSVGAQVHLIGVPYSGAYLDSLGTSKRARSAYYDRLVEEGGRSSVSVDDNRDHDEDRAFLRDNTGHLSAVGWLIVDRSMDEFVQHVVP